MKNYRDSAEHNAIDRVRPFTLYHLNRPTFDLHFCMCMGHDHSSPGIASQGHASRLKVNEQMCVCCTSIHLLRRPVRHRCKKRFFYVFFYFAHVLGLRFLRSLFFKRFFIFLKKRWQSSERQAD